MPLPKNRGKVQRYRTMKSGGETMTCAVMEDAGPKGGKTVCHKRDRKKKR